MSRYETVSVIAPADYWTAREPALGGEWDVFLSEGLTPEIGGFEMTDSGTGTWTADVPNAAVLSANPSHLHVVVEDELLSAVNVVITVTGTDQSGSALTGTATIKPPGYAENQSNSFPEGYGVDVVVSDLSKKFKTVTNVTVAAGGGKRGSKFQIYALPDIDTFRLIGCSGDNNFTTKSRPPVAIACGMNGSAFVKAGRSEPGSLTINQRYMGGGDGLSKYAGRKCTALLRLRKRESLLTEYLVFTGFVPQVSPTLGEGNGESSVGGTGMYEKYLYFAVK